jgi:membrane-associated phospholipid phosphatase
MQQLVSGQDLNFALSKMTGVVSFPSFHTAMALAYVWAFRKTGAIGWVIAALNLVMVAAVPWYGGHYLVDMIAGAATLLLSVALVSNYGKLKASAANAWPGYAAASAGAYSGDGPSR